MDKNIECLKQAYKDMKESKMVLAPKHISQLLKSVAENDFVYNLIAEKILGFDFAGELKVILSGEKSVQELNETEVCIPFTFCLLNEIDNKTIELIAVIRELYGKDTEEEFKAFCDDFVGGFVKKVLSYCAEDEKFDEEESEPNSIEEIFTNGLDERVNYIVTIISEKLNGMKKVKKELKRDLDIVVFSIDLCINLGQFAGVFGLLSGLKNMLQPLKKFKSEIAEINVILDSINNI